MGLLDWLARRRDQSPLVRSDQTGVWVERSGGHVEAVRWAELRVVYFQSGVVGSDEGDTFWRLVGTEGTGCLVPDGARGAAAVVERLRQLPGFDEQAVAAARAASDGRQLFPCWSGPTESGADGGVM